MKHLFTTLAVISLIAAPAAHAQKLVGRAILPADTFAPGPTSGQYIGSGANGRAAPFVNRQPVQGFSALISAGGGTFWGMSDNGFGSLQTSADYRLRVYWVRPNFETRYFGTGTVAVLGFFELRDPDKKIPFAIVNHFSRERHLTGADFDIESMQRAKDGTFWFGDEFGPFLLHTDATGKVLEPPIPLPDLSSPGRELRAPQNPHSEEISALRAMNAVRAHAQSHGAKSDVVFSPYHVLLDDGNVATLVGNRQSPPAGSGVAAASSELFNVGLMKSAGFAVVPWTVNDKPRMTELMKLGVNGIISDRPDLLLEAATEFGLLDAQGLVDQTRFDAQGHRGGRGLRPENTLPAMEVALDYLMSTLETDTGVTADGVSILDHDPRIESSKCRRADGTPYGRSDEVLVKDLTVPQIQAQFVCDRLLPAFPDQTNDLALSPVTVAFAAARALNPYMKPTVQQLFDFVAFYESYYATGAGSGHPRAALRAANADRVRFNIETKRNPRAQFVNRTVDSAAFASALGGVIASNGMQSRADIQSFDFSTLLEVHKRFPSIRTVFLFGDFPIFADTSIAGSDDGTNLQDEAGKNTPWLAGLYWPYRVTRQANPFRVGTSGGFEGMAISPDGRFLYPLLETPIANGTPKELLIHEFDVKRRAWTGRQMGYPLDASGTNIGDFILFSRDEGLIIERDGSQGNLNGFKKIYRVEFPRHGGTLRKDELVDLIALRDPGLISAPIPQGDVGLGSTFAFPFTTIENVIVLDPWTIGVVNDNNYPFSVGRHVGTGQPDDTEFIQIRLDRPLKSRDEDR